MVNARLSHFFQRQFHTPFFQAESCFILVSLFSHEDSIIRHSRFAEEKLYAFLNTSDDAWLAIESCTTTPFGSLKGDNVVIGLDCDTSLSVVDSLQSLKFSQRKLFLGQ